MILDSKVKVCISTIVQYEILLNHKMQNYFPVMKYDKQLEKIRKKVIHTFC